jgi:hypothetical protein
MRKTHEAANPFLIIEQEEPFVPSKGWAEMIRKVYEVDPLLCPQCGTIKLSIGSSATSSLPSWPNGLPLLKVSKKNSGWQSRREGSISEDLCGCFLSILRKKSILLWIVLQFMLIYLSCLPVNMLFWM